MKQTMNEFDFKNEFKKIRPQKVNYWRAILGNVYYLVFT